MISFKKILVIQTAFIGDAILASAALESIHKKFPQAELHILVRNGNETLFENHPYLKKVWVWNKKENKIKNLFKIIADIRKEKFDWLINLHRFASSGLITILSKAKITCGFNKNPFSFLFTYREKHIIGDGSHEVERNHLLLKKYIDTDFCLIIQGDGFVIHPENWTDEFLKYDYIGAPWRNLAHYSFIRVGNGGFSLRSKKLLKILILYLMLNH